MSQIEDFLYTLRSINYNTEIIDEIVKITDYLNNHAISRENMIKSYSICMPSIDVDDYMAGLYYKYNDEQFRIVFTCRNPKGGSANVQHTWLTFHKYGHKESYSIINFNEFKTIITTLFPNIDIMIKIVNKIEL